MRRSLKDGKVEIVPSRSVCIKFAGQIMPKFVFLFHTKHDVSCYVPKIRICYNCYRVGHISKACRSNARCMRCGEAPHQDDKDCNQKDAPPSPPRCINCNGGHLPTSNKCSLIIRQKKDSRVGCSGEHSTLGGQKKNCARSSCAQERRQI
ncbi:hypothetical protein ALC57_15774 [Trachymyrmex cornetzi]|uniref:CCHC-type domain-containing protein n=1 Tax=Trachymyrmex cornetzi TaxID=471704 RepID=A0A151IW60_9HYME|nr:hypothetical protein ALC57_15774 [Trachymyrmex cornetzi]